MGSNAECGDAFLGSMPSIFMFGRFFRRFCTYIFDGKMRIGLAIGATDMKEGETECTRTCVSLLSDNNRFMSSFP